MKDSINDILVTGDQSLTDIISCCKTKQVWYQIAPWKKGLAWNLYKELPNAYFKSFQTSCGTLKSLNTKIDWNNFMKKYDFRINGRKRFDSILISLRNIINLMIYFIMIATYYIHYLKIVLIYNGLELIIFCLIINILIQLYIILMILT